jgi:glycosyltransferase involved in cell wall biosynthesis
MSNATVPCAVVILTLNEEDNIDGVIASVSSWCRNVIVIDSGSTDETCIRAKAAGAEVWIRIPDPVFIIAEQRSWALEELATRGIPWVLFLDADERATSEFLREVDQAMAAGVYDAFYAAPKFMYQGTWLRRFKGFPNWHPRIAKTTARIDGGVWEDFGRGVRAGRITEPYVHNANSKGWADWVQRHTRYAAWEARIETERPAERRRRLRALGRVLGPWRPAAALFHHLVIRGGFLDGGSVWSYARRQFLYELMIVEARRETLRDERVLPR